MTRGEPKVTSSHRERTAICYIRQSSLVQVREHTESTARQYGLAALAAQLGWPAARIEVIDCDLGLSGRSATYREGFKELVARVCMGEVGAVFGLEVSRLARSNADLARLLELARLTDTLVIDSDGVYELSDINDRLLLGLKSQMSEAELHWLTSRLNESKRAAARRGELRVPLPVGFVRRRRRRRGHRPGPGGRRCGRRRVRRVHRHRVGLRGGRRVRRPAVPAPRLRRGVGRAGAVGAAHPRPRRRDLAEPGLRRGVRVRRRTRQIVRPDGSVRSATTELPRDQWEVLIRGHHAGYITFEAYLANEAKLAANRTNAGARPPREGTALCQGIVFCGACGRSVQVRYQDRYPRYECSHSRADHVATPLCGSVRADTVDQAVTAALLAAVEPGQLALALAAADEVTARRRRSDRAAELAVERARYDADRAERAFLACEPENRLVARSLETRWETRLTDLAEAQAALATQLSAQPELPSPGELAATVADLPALWSAPTTSDKDRKRLLRTLLGDVTITPSASDPTQLTVGLRWKSGASQQICLTRPQERHPVARHRPGGHRARLPDRPQPGQQRPGRRAQRRRRPHRHRAALRRRRRSQPAQLPPHSLPRPARRRRAHPPPGRRAHRRVHRHHPLLDQRRVPASPPRPRRPVGHPLPARHRGRLPRPRHRLRPPAPRHRPHPADRRRAQHRRSRPPPGRQARRRLRLGRMGPPARPPRPRRTAVDPLHPAVEQACLQRIASSYKLPDAIKTQATQRLERTTV